MSTTPPSSNQFRRVRLAHRFPGVLFAKVTITLFTQCR
jgi:hypothetical protein